MVIRTLFPLVLLLACGLSLSRAEETAFTEALRRQLGCPLGLDLELQSVWEGPAAAASPEEQARNAPTIRRLEAAHVAEDRFVWRFEFAAPFQPKGATLILYLDADNDAATGRQDKPEVRGTDIMYVCTDGIVAATSHNPAFSGSTGPEARGVCVGAALLLSDDLALHREGDFAVVRARLLSERKPGRSSGTDWFPVKLPLHLDREKPSLLQSGGAGDLGLTRAQVEPATPPLAQRAQPPLPLVPEGRRPQKGCAVPRRSVTVRVAEEEGVARRAAPVSFGFPLPEGALFDPARLRVLDAGREIPAQACATGFWRDDSVSWVLVDLLADLAAREECSLTVEFGPEVRRTPPKQPVTVRRIEAETTVATGPLQATVNLARFNLLQDVRLDLNGDGRFAESERVAASLPSGVELVDAGGRKYTAAAGGAPSLRVEQTGPVKAVLRLEGAFGGEGGAKLFRYVARLTFWAGSPTIEVQHTLVDDYLETEFHDFSSLTVPLTVIGASTATYRLDAEGGPVARNADLAAAPARLLQRDDRSYSLALAGKKEDGRRTRGAISFRAADGRGVTVAVADFWQRWPKGLRAAPDRLDIELWPDLSGETFHRGLPPHLAYPFVEGKYRFKWGMASTDRLLLTFHEPGRAAEPLPHAETQPILAVVSPEWYAATGALGPVVAKKPGEFEAFDEAFDRAFGDHLRQKEASREYGFFNWGDWYGERGRNWGNNEYDLAHALFMQFARTGDRRYGRVALAAARHQADSDSVHAYPDPYYVGANQVHSVCHTGEWSEQLKHPKWSYRYDYLTAATNGHTWSEGMLDAWRLLGEARVMEAAQALGEHIAWHMAPGFEALGTHERSAGWSLQAVVALYRVTRDEAYLDAAKRIALVALREQKFDQGGAWPHLLPGDHAGGVPGAVGNVGFLIGVLTAGLQDLHVETGDPALRKSLVAAAPFLMGLWRPDHMDFQYTSSPGFAQGGSTAVLNGLCAEPLGYVWKLTGDRKYLDRLAEAYLGLVARGSSGGGKGLAQWTRDAPDIMATLKASGETTGLVGKAISASGRSLSLEALAGAKPLTEWRVRGPEEKVVFLRHRGGACTVTAKRTPYGAMPKKQAEGTVALLAPDGTTLRQDRFGTDASYAWQTTLPDTALPGTYRVVIHDDWRSIWDASAVGCARVLPADPMPTFGAPGTARWYFQVPPGTTRFAVVVRAGHDGPFGAGVFDPTGGMAATADGVATADDAASHLRRVEVSAKPEQTGKIWSVVGYARIDLGLQLEGVPPYLALTAEDWFLPQAK